MEAEIGDLSSFWPNEPHGATQQNVFSLFHDSATHLRMRLFEAMAEADPAFQVAMVEAIQKDIKLYDRFLDSMSIVIKDES